MILHIISQTLKGKTINRILMNVSLRKFKLSGKVLDLGAGTIRSSYLDFLQGKDAQITSVDISLQRRPDVTADLEQPLPIESNLYDFVLCFNLLEHIYNHQQLLSEIYRVLKPDRSLIGYVPFLVKYHPDPNDYFRYTKQGLRQLFKDAGFSEVSIEYIGRGPLTAAWAQIEYIAPRFMRWIVTYAVFGLDAMLVKFKPVFKNTYALGYTFTAKK